MYSNKQLEVFLQQNGDGFTGGNVHFFRSTQQAEAATSIYISIFYSFKKSNYYKRILTIKVLSPRHRDLSEVVTVITKILKAHSPPPPF